MLTEITATFTFMCITAGAITLLSAALYATAWAAKKLLEALKIWHFMLLVVGVRLHGKDYADHLFWAAIQERASHSAFAAGLIVKHAMKYRPEDDGSWEDFYAG